MTADGRACDGVTDPGELGLVTPSEPVVVGQDDLFSTLGSG